MADTNQEIIFRCPHCGCRDYQVSKAKKVIRCQGQSSNGEEYCGAEWKAKDAWQCFALVRQFISKLDFEFYQEKLNDTLIL